MLPGRFRSFLALALLASPIPAMAAGLDDCQARFTAAPEAEESAECFYRAGRNADRERISDEVEALLARNPDHPWLLFYLGHLRWEDPASAEEPYRRAAHAFIARRDATGEIRALADSERALNAIESIREQQSGESGRAGLLAIWAEDYYWLAGHLLAAEDVDAAFGVMERLRARTLLEALGRAQAVPAATECPAFARLSEVRRALHPDEALLSFQIGADAGPWGDTGGGSWLLVTTREGTRVHRLRRDRVALRPAVRLFTGLFERRDGSEERPAAGLHADLLAEALGEIPRGISRLVIVPDDALHRLPFAALREAQGELPLAYRYEITVVPSATLWLHWRAHRPGTAAEPLLALADPTPLGGASSPSWPASGRCATTTAPPCSTGSTTTWGRG
jgi:hypothetical protein